MFIAIKLYIYVSMHVRMHVRMHVSKVMNVGGEAIAWDCGKVNTQ